MYETSEVLFESQVENLPLVSRGKVRDIYAVDDDKLLIVASDRLSAFDVVLPTPIPGKGRVLTGLSNFWFGRTQHVVPNHLIPGARTIDLPETATQVLRDGRAMIVRKLKPLPIEAIVRGYLIGSGWKDYKATGAVCGIELPAGLLQASQLPEPIFTPSTKADIGDHDDNISFDRAAELISPDLAQRVKRVSLQLYIEAAEHALARGIIIADTKFEFGLDNDGTLTLIDEVLTPDSSRFWPADTYTPGSSPPSFDKQYVRDYLETLDWDKKAPGPALPSDVVAKTSEKYHEAFRRLTTTS
jgi:phosphoribosylaminoimidazole-succinocarboxamide synthase